MVIYIMKYYNCEECNCEIIFDYSVDNDCWNTVVGKPEGFLCINCFVKKAKVKGIEPKFVQLFVINGEFFNEMEKGGFRSARCPKCRNYMRPTTIMVGETMYEKAVYVLWECPACNSGNLEVIK